ncbi:MAG: YggS family pyridoxal phosphate-dependent enzyme [Syntrophomonadaceae bacterium]|nr:YggS family pyridoxal phosphate-dependent enzyme [Syntrophomonadaceae bacterium]
MFKLRLDDIKNRISGAVYRSKRLPEEITLVAVSKTVDVGAVMEVFRLGVGDFGENRVAELKKKQSSLPRARWHMIGQLQTNKVKDLITPERQPFLIHSLDRWTLAQELDKRGRALNILIDALVQVNVAQEPQKSGLELQEVAQFLEAVGQELGNLRIKGFMTMAPLIDHAEEVRPVFKELTALKRKLGQMSFPPNISLQHLSMGMSQDFEIAIEEGADIVRIGRSLFS